MDLRMHRKCGWTLIPRNWVKKSDFPSANGQNSVYLNKEMEIQTQIQGHTTQNPETIGMVIRNPRKGGAT